MVNYENLPLFPLHLVLYPDMPLPLHIFEPRYRDMIAYCRAENQPFGIVLIQNRIAQLEGGTETTEVAVAHAIGTTARLTQCEEWPDGRLNIVVQGETRFRVTDTSHDQSYLTGCVEPFWELSSDPQQMQSLHGTVVDLFKTYLKRLTARLGRPFSALQLPQDSELLSYAIASVLQISLTEKQSLLEMTATEKRLKREIAILKREIREIETMPKEEDDPRSGRRIVPVNPRELSKLSSLN